MPEAFTIRDLTVALQQKLGAAGLAVRHDAHQALTGEAENIRAKWWLGGRKVTYRMSCRLTDADHTLHFREAVSERSWGIPPPTVAVEATTLSGGRLSGKRQDISVGGGGLVDYGRIREIVENTAVASGWIFHLETGRMP